MKPCNKEILNDIIRSELGLYKVEFAKKNYDLAFRHLERVHIVSQPYPLQHTFIHLKMLKFAILTFRPVEVLIQLIFSLFSGKFSILGIYPAGNTGGANAIFKGKMEIPEDLKKKM